MAQALIMTTIGCALAAGTLRTRLQAALPAADAESRLRDVLAQEQALNRLNAGWLHEGRSCASSPRYGLVCRGSGCDCECELGGVSVRSQSGERGGACRLELSRRQRSAAPVNGGGYGVQRDL